MGTNYNPKIVTDNLVLALDAGNIKSYPGSGNTWLNLASSSYTGTLTNGPIYNTLNGGSITFDATDDYIQVTNSNGFGEASTTPTFSLEVWAKIARKTGLTHSGLQYQYIAGFRNDSNSDMYLLLLDASGTGTPVNTEARVRTAAGSFDIAVNYIPYFNVWTHIVFTANITRSDLYINGTLLGSNTSITGSFGASSSNFRIGQTTNAGNYPVNGDISAVKFYNRALSADEILQNFNAVRGRYGI